MPMTSCIGKSLREVAGGGNNEAWSDVGESALLWTDPILQEPSISEGEECWLTSPLLM